ncbi:MAG: hypothetical protein IJQ74_05940 [Synergistaceae bacterium]|nr:hypothetical protein [Synergistaceae bacterium]
MGIYDDSCYGNAVFGERCVAALTGKVRGIPCYGGGCRLNFRRVGDVVLVSSVWRSAVVRNVNADSLVRTARSVDFCRCERETCSRFCVVLRCLDCVGD